MYNREIRRNRRNQITNMSQTSPKQRYYQLTDWLVTFKKTTPKTNTVEKESRLTYYNKKGN
jgi:hypothetical protein